MADIILFHSVLGLRPVELDLAAQWRRDGHRVSTPDLYHGQRAERYEDGFALMEDIGLPTIAQRAQQAADQAAEDVVLAGISMGAGMVARVWPCKPQASAVLFLAGPGPWPERVGQTPVQMHTARPDPFDDEAEIDAWVAANPGAPLQVFRYDGVGHFFLDPTLPDYSAAASAACRARCRDFLVAIDRSG